MVLAAFAGGQVAVVSAMSALTTEATRGIALGLQILALLTGGALGTAAAGALTDLATTQLALAVLVPVPLVGVLLARTASAQADTDRTADGVGQRGSAAS